MVHILRKKIRMKNIGEEVPAVTKEFSLANARMIDKILKKYTIKSDLLLEKCARIKRWINI